MTEICEKCGNEYVTGKDKIESKDNEYSLTKATVYIERKVGYNTTRINEQYIEEKNLCPKCANELWDILHQAYMKYRFGEA